MLKKPFLNPHIKQIRRGLKDFILWKMGYYDDTGIHPPIADGFTYPRPHPSPNCQNGSATWINHSSFLVSAEGIHLLTDPIFSARCSPIPFIGPKRHHPPGLRLDQLPKIDLVLISHDHYDHLDKKTVLDLNRQNPQIRWIVPLKVKKKLIKWGINHVEECGWWEEQSIQFGDGLELKMTAVPAQHFSGRSAHDRNCTLWVGWVVEWIKEDKTLKRLYFAGDTGYNPIDFKAIGETFGAIDLSLIPIGCYAPKAFMQPVHIGPQEAVRIHREVNSRLSVAMHWKTFCLSDEPMDLPPYELWLQMKSIGLDPQTFVAVEPGDEIAW